MGATFRDRRVMITGGLGFTGFTLAWRLVELDARVTLADSLIPEYCRNSFSIASIEVRPQRSTLSLFGTDLALRYNGGRCGYEQFLRTTMCRTGRR